MHARRDWRGRDCVAASRSAGTAAARWAARRRKACRHQPCCTSVGCCLQCLSLTDTGRCQLPPASPRLPNRPRQPGSPPAPQLRQQERRAPPAPRRQLPLLPPRRAHPRQLQRAQHAVRRGAVRPGGWLRPLRHRPLPRGCLGRRGRKGTAQHQAGTRACCRQHAVPAVPAAPDELRHLRPVPAQLRRWLGCRPAGRCRCSPPKPPPAPRLPTTRWGWCAGRLLRLLAAGSCPPQPRRLRCSCCRRPACQTGRAPSCRLTQPPAAAAAAAARGGQEEGRCRQPPGLDTACTAAPAAATQQQQRHLLLHWRLQQRHRQTARACCAAPVGGRKCARRRRTLAPR